MHVHGCPAETTCQEQHVRFQPPSNDKAPQVRGQDSYHVRQGQQIRHVHVALLNELPGAKCTFATLAAATPDRSEIKSLVREEHQVMHMHVALLRRLAEQYVCFQPPRNSSAKSRAQHCKSGK